MFCTTTEPRRPFRNLPRLSTLLPVLAIACSLVLPCMGQTPSAARTGGTRWGANYFPDVVLTTHEGERVRFFTDLIRDKVVVINFIYTSCPDACPLETARLGEVQGILGDRVGRDVFFYSITIDPAVDTPEVLAGYAKRFQVGPGWTFLTGSDRDITLLRKKLGLYIEEIQDGSGDHNLSLVIGNQRTGRWTKSSPFENPYVLATQIGSWLTNFSTPTRTRNDYSEAPALRRINTGESLFRTRCSTCHALADDGKSRVGPSLRGIGERRKHDWLVRWIREPDAMLAEGDPTALSLFEAYGEVPMPNMQLSAYEAEEVLDYIAAESRRLGRRDAILAQAPALDLDARPSCCQKESAAVLSSSEPEEECCCSEEGDSASSAVESLALDKDSSQPSPRTLWGTAGLALAAIGLFLRRRTV